MTEDMSFADWLTEQLHKWKMTQKDLADKAGVGKSSINKIARRMVVRPDPRTYVAIAKALGVSPISVFRIAGILPPDPELPELEAYKTALARLSPKMRQVGLGLIETLAEYE
jgi:transcriptional regulator with XRE-family HTH domain